MNCHCSVDKAAKIFKRTILLIKTLCGVDLLLNKLKVNNIFLAHIFNKVYDIYKRKIRTVIGYLPLLCMTCFSIFFQERRGLLLL